MAKDLTARIRPPQGGFSLLELLVAATILAIGILGLTMLQAMSLRATRGSANMVTAARIAEMIMDQAELEGRLSWLNITDANRVAPSLADLNSFNLKYIKINNGQTLFEDFNIKGGPVDVTDPDPTGSVAFFNVSTRRVAVVTAGGPGSVGQMSDLNVRVEFTDSVGDGQTLKRTYNISRRIIHG